MRTIYFDASVPLRWVFRQPGFIEINDLACTALASRLTRAECWRTLDRRRFEPGMGDEERARREVALAALFENINQIELSSAILTRVASPMPSPLGTLDAIHLATALLWRELSGEDIEFATHDRELAQAARLHRFPVIGV